MATSLKHVAATAVDFGRDVKDSVSVFSRTAGRKIDKARGQTGGALHAVASYLRKGSAKIDATASFVEEASFQKVSASTRRFAQKHMLLTVLAGAVAGFWAATALNRCARASDNTAETAQ